MTAAEEGSASDWSAFDSSARLRRRLPLEDETLPAMRRMAPGGPEHTVEELPDRYEIRDLEDGTFLVCGEAPRVMVSIDRSYAFSEADARRLGERVILLDGAGQFGPLIDHQHHLYNLDHHVDCLRAFTLAACQQALIVVLKGLDLDSGDWTVYANEPDLDTVFALWVLLNHRRVRQLDERQRDAVLPLLHLEGAIDANGFEIAEQSGLPQQRLDIEKARLDKLHAIELGIKKSGEWASTDLAEYTRGMLLEIDKLVYQASDFTGFARVEQVYGHVDIGSDRVAVVCRDGSGIYEVEKRLKKTWGDRLGIIALEGAPNQITLRRSASLAGIDLEQAYDKLNLLDPRVDGRPPEKRWGGSDEIGGSPRPDGTALTPRELGQILKMTYKPIRGWQHVQRYATTVVWALLLALASGAAVIAWRAFAPASDHAAATELTLAAVVTGLGSWLLTRKLSRGWTWLFGWRRPAGRDWLALTPLVLIGALGGGVWVPAELAGDARSLTFAAGAVVVAALAVELCFRGLVHGLLVLDSTIQTVSGRWFVSGPALASATLYALSTAAASWLVIAPPVVPLDTVEQMVCSGLAGFLVGLVLVMIRERSASLWPGFITVLAGGALRIAWELLGLGL